MRFGRSSFTRLLLALLVGALGVAVLPALAPTASATPAKGDSVDVCGAPAPGTASCLSKVRVDDKAKQTKPSKKATASPDVVGNSGGYDPAYLQSAYNLQSLSGANGAGRTVAIVDAYDAPNAESDLAYYRNFFGLPECSTANGCFRKVNQNGLASPLPNANSGWAQEISLDVDMVSAVCPLCNVLLVEANSNSFNDLSAGVNQAVAMGAVAVSNSYGGSEFSGETSLDSAYDHPGVMITVSSGDNGYGTEYPAASPYVTAVGGTSLNQTTNTGTRNATESVWNGAGSGCSAFESKPSWQHDTCGQRTVTDVSAVADPNTGVWVRYSNGWYIFGGTSASSPIVAGVSALATNPAGSPSAPYDNPSAFFDVTSGSNGSCGGSYLCTGVAGYDGPTGLGTPNGAAGFESGGTPPPDVGDYSITATPASRTVSPGGSTTYTVDLTSTGGYSSSVALSATGLPAGATASFSPASVVPTASGATATMTVKTSSTTPAGNDAPTITATGTNAGRTVHTASVNLTVSGFRLSLNASSVTVPRGSNRAVIATLTGYGTFANPATLSLSNLPSGVTAAINPKSVVPTTGGATSTITFTASTRARATTRSVTVKASATGAASQSAIVTLTIT